MNHNLEDSIQRVLFLIQDPGTEIYAPDWMLLVVLEKKCHERLYHKGELSCDDGIDHTELTNFFLGKE